MTESPDRLEALDAQLKASVVSDRNALVAVAQTRTAAAHETDDLEAQLAFLIDMRRDKLREAKQYDNDQVFPGAARLARHNAEVVERAMFRLLRTRIEEAYGDQLVDLDPPGSTGP